jgi:hypothetical protein
VSPIECHPAFGFGNRPIHVFDGLRTPTTLVMLSASELGSGSTKMLESRMHVRLVGAHGTETHSCHHGENDDT